jgi:hypothetical protein
MIQITDCSCGKRCEGTTGRCASCNRLSRKVDNVKLPDDPKPIAKVSDNMSKELAKYAPLKKKFLHGRWCGVHGKPCIPVEVHHTRGRGLGFEDEWAEEKGVTRLNDVRFWLAVCRESHDQIENNPDWAKAQGYSEDRLTVKKNIWLR